MDSPSRALASSTQRFPARPVTQALSGCSRSLNRISKPDVLSSPSTVEKACTAFIVGHASVSVCTFPVSEVSAFSEVRMPTESSNFEAQSTTSHCFNGDGTCDCPQASALNFSLDPFAVDNA